MSWRSWDIGLLRLLHQSCSLLKTHAEAPLRHQTAPKKIETARWVLQLLQ